MRYAIPPRDFQQHNQLFIYPLSVSITQQANGIRAINNNTVQKAERITTSIQAHPPKQEPA